MERIKEIAISLFGNQLALRERFFNFASLGGALATVLATLASGISINRYANANNIPFWDVGLSGMIICFTCIVFFLLTFAIFHI